MPGLIDITTNGGSGLYLNIPTGSQRAAELDACSSCVALLQRFTEMLDDNDLDVVIYPVHGNVPPVIGNFSPDFSAPSPHVTGTFMPSCCKLRVANHCIRFRMTMDD